MSPEPEGGQPGKYRGRDRAALLQSGRLPAKFAVAKTPGASSPTVDT